MTTNVDEWVQQMCHSPTGCAFLLTVEENDLAPEVAADLHVAMNVSAVAINAIDMWAADYPRSVALALENGPRLMPLAQEIMAQPAVRAWFAPAERSAQWIILGDEGEVVIPTLCILGAQRRRTRGPSARLRGLDDP